MIPFDFEYHQPSSITEAVKLFQQLSEQGKQPMYYGGGTEIITRARLNRVYTNAVIDLKGIPECRTLQFQDDQLVIGSVVTLTELSESNPFPLLTKTAIGAADHTARNKITLGGNICGVIIYREAVLPLLLSDSRFVIAGPAGLSQASVREAFVQQIRLQQGEFLVQIITDRSYTQSPWTIIKKRRIGKVGYPLVTVAALKKDDQIRTAFSGLCSFPFRSEEMERELNNSSIPVEARVQNATRRIPAPVLNNVEGSADYRIFVLGNTLEDVLAQLKAEGGS